jgi:hypothetical protein
MHRPLVVTQGIEAQSQYTGLIILPTSAPVQVLEPRLPYQSLQCRQHGQSYLSFKYPQILKRFTKRAQQVATPFNQQCQGQEQGSKP